MASQIMFLQKNFADYSNVNVTATASESPTYAYRVLNRNNTSAWITTGSVDANSTTLTIDMVDQKLVSVIILAKHNFKSYTVKYWNGTAYVDFAAPINVTANAAGSTAHFVTPVSTSRVQITITGTIVANADKFLYQFILTSKVGQLTGWPVLKNVTHSKNAQNTKMLSGKYNVNRNVGSFGCNVSVTHWKSAADLTIIESLYNAVEGFLVWICAGDEAQFINRRIGYRFEDIYLMQCLDDYQPDYVEGIYVNGLALNIQLGEVVD